MFNKIAIAMVAAAGIATSASALTNILINPSFESGSGVDTAKNGGSTDITGWTVYTRKNLPGTGAFYASTGVSWNAFDGTRSVEVNGNSQGGIYQDVTLVVGKQYKFSYAYSVDPNGTRKNTPFIASVRSVNQIESYTRPIGHSATNMQWITETFLFTALNKANRVSFDSGVGGQYGAVVDAVSLQLVPEPATWAMLITGFGMVGFSMRRRRAGVTSVAN